MRANGMQSPGKDRAATVLRTAAATEKCQACGCLHAALLEAGTDDELSRLADVLLAGLPRAVVNCRECAECPPADAIGQLHGVETGGGPCCC